MLQQLRPIFVSNMSKDFFKGFLSTVKIQIKYYEQLIYQGKLGT
jgi:hypothetical protein